MTPNLHTSSVNSEAVEAAAAAWVARQDNPDAWGQVDEQAFQAWLGEHIAHRVAWLRVRQAWRHADAMQALEPADIALGPGLRPPPAPAQRRGLRVLMGLLLAGVLAVAAGVALRSTGEERYVTAVGGRQALTLADGSHVTLNTQTRARAIINNEVRKFWLDEGEAFFEVQRDPAHPFVITAGRDRITVLGTKFSVRHEDGYIQVTVVEGRVQLDRGAATSATSSAPAKPTILAKYESATVRAGGMLLESKTPQQAQQALSWREGLLEFDNKPLSAIAAEFNRYNRRKLVVQEAAAPIRLSGRFDANNVDAFVRLIGTAYGVESTAEGDELRLSVK